MGSSPSGSARSSSEPFVPKGDLRLPEHLRSRLAEPFGPVYDIWALPKHLMGCERLVAVGDVITVSLIQMRHFPNVALFDYKTRRSEDVNARERIALMPGRLVHVRNPAGTITLELWEALVEAFERGGPTKIEVEGEEDLAAIPAIALAPERSCVLYGVPGHGVCIIRVEKQMKELAFSVLRQMEP